MTEERRGEGEGEGARYWLIYKRKIKRGSAVRGSRSSMAPTLLDTHYVCALAFRLCYVAQPPKSTTMEPSLSAGMHAVYRTRGDLRSSTERVNYVDAREYSDTLESTRACNRVDPAVDGSYVFTDIVRVYATFKYLAARFRRFLRFVRSRHLVLAGKIYRRLRAQSK